MTLRHFLDAAHAILVDEHARQGSLMQALDSQSMWRAGGPPEEVAAGTPSSEVPPAVERDIEVENAKALSELNKMLGGVTGFGGGR